MNKMPRKPRVPKEPRDNRVPRSIRLKKDLIERVLASGQNMTWLIEGVLEGWLKGEVSCPCCGQKVSNK